MWLRLLSHVYRPISNLDHGVFLCGGVALSDEGEYWSGQVRPSCGGRGHGHDYVHDDRHEHAQVSMRKPN